MLNHTLNRTAIIAAIIVASIIVIAKTLTWFMTGSLSLLASLIDSSLDIIASAINLVAVNYAAKPADDDHRFGHGKAEDLATFIQSIFIIFSGMFILFKATKRFFYPEQIEHNVIGLYVMAFSIVVNFILISFQKFVIGKTNSNIVKADYLHYKTDFLLNLSVAVIFAISLFCNLEAIDPAFACLIAIYILYSSFAIFKKAFDSLMDKELDSDKKLIIENIILSHKEILGLHAVRTRYSGSVLFVQCHLEMSGTLTLNQAHEIADYIEKQIAKTFPDAQIFIHYDPYYIKDGEKVFV